MIIAYSISEELFEEYCNQDQPHECYYYISTHLNDFSQSGFIKKPSVNILTFFKCGHTNESALDPVYFC